MNFALICFVFSLIFGFLFGLTTTIDLRLDKCYLEDSACMVKAFQNAIPIIMKGVPTLDIEVMDVLKLEELNFNLTGLVFTLRDGRLRGCKDIIVDNIEWDTKKQQAVINYHVNYSELWGSYTASGKILLLPIYGHGDLNIQFRKLHVKVTLFYDVYKKNGKSFARVKRYTNDFDVRESIRYNMTNLFNGNNELGTTLLNVMNDNWKQVCQEFGKPLMDSVSKKILKNINKLLSHSPLEEITLNYI